MLFANFSLRFLVLASLSFCCVASSPSIMIEQALGKAILETLSTQQELSLFQLAIQQAEIVTQREPQIHVERASRGQSLPRGECQQCESISDCQKGLMCPRRRSSESVPGCLGGESYDKYSSFCTNPIYVGLGSLPSSQQLTVFAPVDSAFQKDQVFRSFTAYTSAPAEWLHHLQRLLLNQFVEGGSYSREDIFEGSIGSTLLNMEGQSLWIEQDQETIAGAAIIGLDRNASGWEVYVGSDGQPRGVVHPLDSFFVNSESWINQTLLDFILPSRANGGSGSGSGRNKLASRQKQFLTDRLSSLQDDGLATALLNFASSGMTLLVPSDAALEDVNPSDSMDEDHTILYNSISKNNYIEDLVYGSCIQMPTLHPLQLTLMAHKSSENGTVRYGNARFNQEIYASNGLVHVTDQILKPPKLLELLSDTTCLPDYSLCYELLNVTLVVLGQQNLLSNQSLTVHCPLRGGRNSYDSVIPHKLPLSAWSGHFEELSSKLIVSDVNSKETEGDSYVSDYVKGPRQVTAIDGVALLKDYQYWEFRSVRDVLTRSMGYDSYFTNEHSGTYSFQSGLDRYEHSGPVTVFAPPFVPLALVQQQESINDNHIFEGNLYMEKLLEKDGELLTSVNGKKWIVSVLDANVFLQAWADEEIQQSGSAPVKVGLGSNPTGTLASGGVVHAIDAPLMDSPLVTRETAMAACAQEIQSMESCSPFEERYWVDSRSCNGKGSDCVREAIDYVQSNYRPSQGCSFLTCTCCRRGCEAEHQALVACLVQKATGDDLGSCEEPYCKYSSSSDRGYGDSDSSDDGGLAPWEWAAIAIACGSVVMCAVIWREVGCRCCCNGTRNVEAPTKNTTFSVLSLTLALVGLLSFYLGFLLGPLAIIAGAVAWSRIRHKPEEFGGNCQATTGIALGLICTVGYSTVLIMFVADRLDPDDDYYDDDKTSAIDRMLLAVACTLAVAVVTAFCLVGYYRSWCKRTDEGTGREEAQPDESMTIEFIKDEVSGPSAGDRSPSTEGDVDDGQVGPQEVYSDERF